MFLETSVAILIITIVIVISYWCGCNDTKLKIAAQNNNYQRIDDVSINRPIIVVALVAIIGFMFWAVGL